MTTTRQEEHPMSDIIGIATGDDIVATIPGPAFRAILRIAHDTLDGMDADELSALDIDPAYREVLVGDTVRLLDVTAVTT
jgi:hypothetical protein